MAAIYERGTSSMIRIVGDICVRLHRPTVQGIASRVPRKQGRKEGRKDNEGVERWIPRNHTPRRGRCDLFSVTLRCLTGPMTSGVTKARRTNRGAGWIDPTNVSSWVFIPRGIGGEGMSRKESGKVENL